MNDSAPKTTGLQFAIILAAILAMILGVTAYKLYRENLKLKQQLEQQRNPATVRLAPSETDSLFLSPFS